MNQTIPCFRPRFVTVLRVGDAGHPQQQCRDYKYACSTRKSCLAALF